VIRRGDYQYEEVSVGPEVFAFTRGDQQQRILCIFNRAAAAAEVKLAERLAPGQFLYGEKNLLSRAGNRFSMSGKSVAVMTTMAK